jgi:hypothetical protein
MLVTATTRLGGSWGRARHADVGDWVYDFVEAFVAFMDRMTLCDGLVLLVAGTTVVPLVVLIHRAEHAIAALALHRRIGELTVGDDDPGPDYACRAFRLHLEPITGRGCRGLSLARETGHVIQPRLPSGVRRENCLRHPALRFRVSHQGAASRRLS